VAFGNGPHILNALLVADGILEEIRPFASLCEEEVEYGKKSDVTDVV